MISLKAFKQYNFINEQLGHTITWTALYDLRKRYSEFKKNTISASNIATYDWHSDFKQKDNHVIVDHFKYWKRSKAPNKGLMRDIDHSDLLELKISRRCTNTGNTKERINLSLPSSPICSSDQSDQSDGSFWFDKSEHPHNSKTDKLLEPCGVVYCFHVPFQTFIEYLANKYSIDLSQILDWDKYQSSINPHSLYIQQKRRNKPKKFKLKLSKNPQSKRPSNTENQNDTAIEPSLKKSKYGTLDSEIFDINMSGNDCFQGDARSHNDYFVITGSGSVTTHSDSSNDENTINIATNYQIETEVTSYSYSAPIPKAIPIKTEKIIVDAFRKELIPFIDVNLNNTEVRKAIRAICRKYFFSMKQVKGHKDALRRLRKDDPKLSYFENVTIPDLSGLNTNDKKTETIPVTPMNITKDWIASYNGTGLQTPFNANQLFKYLRNDFDDEHKNNNRFCIADSSHLCLNDVTEIINDVHTIGSQCHLLQNK